MMSAYVIILGLIAIHPGVAPLQIDFDYLKHGVVKIQSSNSGKSGAGIILGKKDDDLYILTAYHVVLGSPGTVREDAIKNLTIQVFFYDDQNERSYPASLLARGDINLDIAIIKISQITEKHLSANFPKFRVQGEPQEETAISTIGHPDGLDWQHYRNAGTISRKNNNGDYRRFIFTSPSIREGNSGGPVFDENGSLLGMMTRHDPSGNAEAVKINDGLRSVLKEWGVPTINIGGESEPTMREFNEDFAKLPKLKNWDAPKQWTVKDERLYLVSTPRIGYIKGYCFQNSAILFDLLSLDGIGAAWALNVKDDHNYYLFYLSGERKKFLVYKVHGNTDIGKLSPDYEQSIDLELRKGGHYRVEIEVKERSITHWIRVADGSKQNGKKIRLYTLEEISAMNCGSVGFRTVGAEQFSIDDVIVSPISP
jgi:V8-like Glu-specific endopeptidase